MKIVKPTQCHLWAGKRIGLDQVRALKQKAIYEDDSHLIRALMECPECGQNYYFEFYEVIDWDNGNDSQYHTYIPIEDDAATIDALNQMSSMQLLSLSPRLQDDWGKDETKKPTQAVWIGFEERGE